MTTTPTPPPEGEREHIAQLLLDEISRGCDINEGEALRCADRLIAAGYRRAAPTQGDRETAQRIVSDIPRKRLYVGEETALTDAIATALAAQRATLEARVVELETALVDEKAAAMSGRFKTRIERDEAIKRATAAEAALATAREDALRRAEEIANEVERQQEADHGAANTGGAGETAIALAAERARARR
jgi:hypothetical protein